MREHDLGGPVERFGITERLGRARDRGLRAAPLDVEQRRTREGVSEPVLCVRRAQVGERRLERGGVVGERVVTQRVERVGEWPLAALAELFSELHEHLAVRARRLVTAALEVDHREVLDRLKLVEPVTARAREGARLLEELSQFEDVSWAFHPDGRQVALQVNYPRRINDQIFMLENLLPAVKR